MVVVRWWCGFYYSNGPKLAAVLRETSGGSFQGEALNGPIYARRRQDEDNRNIDNKRTALVQRLQVALDKRYEDLVENEVVAATAIASFSSWPRYKDREAIRG